MRRVGYTDCGLTELLGEAKLPKGSFYNYFPTKEAFAVEVVEAFYDWHDRLLAGLAGDFSRPALSRVEEYFRTLLDEAERVDPAERGCLIALLALEKPATSEPIRQALCGAFRRWQDRLVELLCEAQGSGELAGNEDAERLASLLLHTWEGALLRARLEQDTWPLADFVSTALPRLLRA